MLVEHTTLDCVFSLCIFGGSVNEVSSMDVDCCGSVAEVSSMETGSSSLVDEVPCTFTGCGGLVFVALNVADCLLDFFPEHL